VLGQLELVKQSAMGQIQPIKPLGGVGGGQGQMTIPDPNESASKAIATDPQRMARRQDLIDEMLPHAESIALDPDGGIKLKMPDPVARAMKMQDAQVKQVQQQQQHETQQQLAQSTNAQQVAQQAQQAAGQAPAGQPQQPAQPGQPVDMGQPGPAGQQNGGGGPDQMAAMQRLFGAGQPGQ